MAQMDVNALLADILPKPGDGPDDSIWTPFSGPHLVFGDNLKEGNGSANASPEGFPKPKPKADDKRKNMTRRRKTSLTVEIEDSGRVSPQTSPQPSPHGAIGPSPSPSHMLHRPGISPKAAMASQFANGHLPPKSPASARGRPKPQAKPMPRPRVDVGHEANFNSSDAYTLQSAMQALNFGNGQPPPPPQDQPSSFLPPYALPIMVARPNQSVPCSPSPSPGHHGQDQASFRGANPLMTPTGYQSPGPHAFFQANQMNSMPMLDTHFAAMNNGMMPLASPASARGDGTSMMTYQFNNSNSNSLSSTPGPSPSPKMGGKAGKPRPVCLDWLQGKCNTKRWSCKFAHPQLPSTQSQDPSQPQTVPLTPNNMAITVGSHPMAIFSPPLVMSPGPMQGSVVLLTPGMSPPCESPSNSASGGSLSPAGAGTPFACLSPQGTQYVMIPIQSNAPALVQVQPVPQPASTHNVCSVWELTGTCKFGDFCRDFHPPLDDRVPRTCLNPRDNPFSQKAAQVREMQKMQEGENSPPLPPSPASSRMPANSSGLPVVVSRFPPPSPHAGSPENMGYLHQEFGPPEIKNA